MLHVAHEIPAQDVRLGIVRAEGLTMDRYPLDFDRRLEAVLVARSRNLNDDEEARRAAARNMLRNGSYKPTGRGKPASEYLLRAAADAEYTFPRINGPVDICNYLSLKHIVPISLWDLDRSATRRFVFRLGRSGEGYRFNRGGQRIDVEDLLVGCRVQDGGDPAGEPIVNPVRDSLETKTSSDTTAVGAVVYAPSAAFSAASLISVCEEFAGLLSECGDETKTACGVANPASMLDV